MIGYIPKVTRINVYSLTADVWTQILTMTEAKAIRGIRIKSRFTRGAAAPTSYDIAFNSSPATGATTTGNGFFSYSGAENDFSFEPRNGIWARTKVAGVIEVMLLN